MVNNDDHLISALKQIQLIVDQALNGLSKPTAVERKKTKKARVVEESSPTKLPDYILLLRDRGFFKHPQTAAEAHLKLQADYHCDLNRVAVALLRLAKKRELRKTSKKVGDKQQIAYVW